MMSPQCIQDNPKTVVAGCEKDTALELFEKWLAVAGIQYPRSNTLIYVAYSLCMLALISHRCMKK